MKDRFETFTVLINDISRSIHKLKMAEMAEFSLRSSHVSCLYYLYKQTSLTAKALCDICSEDKANISRSVKYLEEKGYLVCESKRAKRYQSPLMLTERCFIRENFGCAQCDKASLSDRMGVRFPMMREWEHRNLILNSRPTYMLDRRKEMKGAGVSGGALIFTCEEEMQTLDILDAFRRCLPPKTDIKRIK